MIKNLSVRAFLGKDIPQIVAYWSNLTLSDLKRMGVNPKKLPTPKQFTASLKKLIKTPLKKVDTYYLIWTINKKPIGYASLRNIVYGKIADMHLHIWDTENQGKGFGKYLYCLSVKKFYQLFKLKMILCEPRTNNALPNKMLQKIGFTRWKQQIGTPSVICVPCELSSYIIDLETALKFLSTRHL